MIELHNYQIHFNRFQELVEVCHLGPSDSDVESSSVIFHMDRITCKVSAPHVAHALRLARKELSQENMYVAADYLYDAYHLAKINEVLGDNMIQKDPDELILIPRESINWLRYHADLTLMERRVGAGKRKDGTQCSLTQLDN